MVRTEQVVTVVLLEKNGVLAALTLEAGDGGRAARVCRFDPRSELFITQGPWEWAGAAGRAFEYSVRESEAAGWAAFYEGPPLRG